MTGRIVADMVRNYHVRIQQTLNRLSVEAIARISHEILSTYDRSGDIFVFGNGGSAATASHMACDLGKNTAVRGMPRLRVRSLTDNCALISALANDLGYETIFSEQLVQAPIEQGDLAIAISGSGNSPNVLRGINTARAAGARTIGITGFRGGCLAQIADISLVVDSDCMEIIEDTHLIVNHAITTAVRTTLCQRAGPHLVVAG